MHYPTPADWGLEALQQPVADPSFADVLKFLSRHAGVILRMDYKPFVHGIDGLAHMDRQDLRPLMARTARKRRVNLDKLNEVYSPELTFPSSQLS